MSSSPTAPTSTTASWNRLGAVPSRQLDVLACGALAGHVREIVARRGWPVAVRSLPAVLHNRPQKIISAGRTVRGVSPAVRPHASPWPTPTAAPTARSMSCAPGTGCGGCPDCTATTCSPARRGWRRCSGPSRAPTCSPTSCCAASTAACWPSSAWTGTRSCGRTTSGTTGGWSGWPRNRPRRWPPRRSGWRAMFGLPLTRIDTGVSRLEAALAALVGEAGGI